MRVAIVLSAIIISFAMIGNNETPILLIKNFESFKGIMLLLAVADMFDLVIKLITLKASISNFERSKP